MSLRIAAFAVAWFATAVLAAEEPVHFSAAEIRSLASHRLTHTQPVDHSNAQLQNPAAIALGRQLFFDSRLSAGGSFSCATCHPPGTSYTSGKVVATSDTTYRKVPSLYNTAFNRWYAWDGHVDSLWMQVLAVFANQKEFAATPASVSRLVQTDASLRAGFEQVFGRNADADRASSINPDNAQQLEVQAAKAIAAYVSTLQTSDTPFDRFVDSLTGKAPQPAPVSAAAQRGAKIFAGKGQCGLCHRGPFFTDGEFHNIGLARSHVTGNVEPGRAQGVATLLDSPFNLLGRYSDAQDPETADKTRYVQGAALMWGAFKTPGLRNVAVAAPYTHDGRFATLPDVLHHYAEVRALPRNDAPMDPMLERVLLSPADTGDLIAFLQTLTAQP